MRFAGIKGSREEMRKKTDIRLHDLVSIKKENPRNSSDQLKRLKGRAMLDDLNVHKSSWTPLSANSQKRWTHIYSLSR
jgi:trehalose/maltose hydrolase-like predicted phosphorylase